MEVTYCLYYEFLNEGKFFKLLKSEC